MRVGFCSTTKSQAIRNYPRPPISPREIVKNDLKRRQRALRRLKSTVTKERFVAVALTRVRTMPAR
jgi:hypothetical protein